VRVAGDNGVDDGDKDTRKTGRNSRTSLKHVQYIKSLALANNDPLTMARTSSRRNHFFRCVHNVNAAPSVSRWNVVTTAKCPITCCSAHPAGLVRIRHFSSRSVSVCCQRCDVLLHSSVGDLHASPYHQVLFICDLHAHLAKTEIIGLLGGTWNAETREVVVRAAFPCRALPIDSDAKVNVELDPASDVEVSAPPR
jgi:hypothetical protein